jgi:hypothetical protein
VQTAKLLITVIMQGLDRSEEGNKEQAAAMADIRQDWEPVVIRKKALNAAASRDEKAVNAARRAGGPIETVKKCMCS